MRHLNSIAVSLLAALSIFGCARPNPDPADAPFPKCRNATRACLEHQDMFRRQQAALSWIKVADAEKDADQAIAVNDPRLLGVYGYSTEVPGVDGAHHVPNGCGLRMIQGTSDYIAHDSFFAAPRAYARRYNARVLARTRCLAKPPARRGMIWQEYADAERLSLSFGVPESSYDLVSLHCYPGRIEFRQTRRGLPPGRSELTLSSTTRMVVNANASAPDQDLSYRDFAYVRANLPVTHAVWREFGQTGRLRVDGQDLDAAYRAEMRAVASFLTACASRQP